MSTRRKTSLEKLLSKSKSAWIWLVCDVSEQYTSDMNGSSNYTDVLLEDMNSKFDTILEIVTPLVQLPQQIRELREDIDEIKSDMMVIKVVAKDHSSWLKNHEVRLTKVEGTVLG